MANNNLQYAAIFQKALDLKLIQGATSGWMEPNANSIQYNGGKTIKIGRLSTNGLGDYDRDSGFPIGSVSLVFDDYTMSMDRGRKFRLDAMDVDEAGFLNSAANVFKVFAETQLIPELDAYRYSKIASIATTAGKSREYTLNDTDILKQLRQDILTLQDATGLDDSNLIISMSYAALGVLENSEKISKFLNVVDFTKGDIQTKVKALNGVPIIPIASTRFKTAYKFNDGTTDGQKGGGFIADVAAKDINWLITSLTAPLAPVKTNVTSIFDPTTNQLANAWDVNSRIYHDCWITTENQKAIFANLKPNS